MSGITKRIGVRTPPLWRGLLLWRSFRPPSFQCFAHQHPESDLFPSAAVRRLSRVAGVGALNKQQHCIRLRDSANIEKYPVLETARQRFRQFHDEVIVAVREKALTAIKTAVDRAAPYCSDSRGSRLSNSPS
jgi:hypothetical protein